MIGLTNWKPTREVAGIRPAEDCMSVSSGSGETTLLAPGQWRRRLIGREVPRMTLLPRSLYIALWISCTTARLYSLDIEVQGVKRSDGTASVRA